MSVKKRRRCGNIVGIFLAKVLISQPNHVSSWRFGYKYKSSLHALHFSRRGAHSSLANVHEE